MRWEDERYVRLYTRDTTDWLALSFDAQALLCLLLRKVDRAGLLPLGRHGKRGVAIAVGHPREWERLAPALDELLADGCCSLSENGETLVFPNFIAAQESTASAVQRTREYRERERDRVRAGLPVAAQKSTVIYFIQSEHGGAIKIGRADDLAKRVMGLQTGRPDKLVVLAAAEGTRQNERDIHEAFASHRERGEWFHPAPVLLAFIAAVSRDGGRVAAAHAHVSGYAASPETSPAASLVTPNRTVLSHAEPSRTVPETSASPAVAAPLVLEVQGAAQPEKPKPARKQPDGEHHVLWRALEAEYARVMGHPYASGNAGADAVAVKWLRETAKAAPEEAVRRWGNLLAWSKTGFPSVTGFQSLRQHWVAPQVLGALSSKPARPGAYARAEDSQAAHERYEAEGQLGVVDLTTCDPFARSGT